MPEKIAFIGLGVMGYPMAGHLANAGHAVTVFNRSPDKAKRWVDEFGGRMTDAPADAVQHADYVFCCVGNDADLTEVMTGHHGVFERLSPGTVVVDHTTVSATLARQLAGLAMERDAWFIDAPVSGGQAGAESGKLTVMAGGDARAFARVQPLIDHYALYTRLLGPPGSGQMAKMVNQICVAGVVQGLAEGLHFADAAGMDVSAVIDVISRGAAQSWQMDNRSATMAEGKFDFGFATDWMRKDLGIALDEARHNGARLPLTALVDQFYAQLQARGGGRWDTSSLIALLQTPANSS